MVQLPIVASGRRPHGKAKGLALASPGLEQLSDLGVEWGAGSQNEFAGSR